MRFVCWILRFWTKMCRKFIFVDRVSLKDWVRFYANRVKVVYFAVAVPKIVRISVKRCTFRFPNRGLHLPFAQVMHRHARATVLGPDREPGGRDGRRSATGCFCPKCAHRRVASGIMEEDSRFQTYFENLGWAKQHFFQH